MRLDDRVPEDDVREAARIEYVQATERYLAACGLKRADMLMTDVVTVVGQRGFSDESGTSLVVSMTPTDTPEYTVTGLLRFATIEHDEQAAGFYRWANSEDDEDGG